MANPTARVETAETEAAAWHLRLGGPGVSAQEIGEFFAWRSASEANADAYRRVEHIWAHTLKLKTDADIARALDDALTRRRPEGVEQRRRLPRTLIGLTAIGAALVLGFSGWFWWQGQGIGQPRFSTSVGEQRFVQLADGSSVRLDTDTRIRVRYDKGRRTIDLESGQAMFEVAHDASRPFVVRAGDVSVTAVGTVFDVRREPAGARVTLVSGVVDVVGGSEPKTRMAADSQANVRAGGAVVQPVDARTETSWTEGKITFRDTPLKDAVAEVNRYLTDKVELDADVRENILVNGVFRTGDRDAFVSTAAEVLKLRPARQPDGSVRLTPRAK